MQQAVIVPNLEGENHAPPLTARPQLLKRWGSPSFSFFEIALKAFLYASCLVSVVTTVGILLVLATEVGRFFEEVSIFEFLFGTTWSALIEPRSFGVLPLVSGTLQIGLGAVLFAIPIGAGAALFLSEYVTGSKKHIIKAIVEVLAGVPSVVYGFFAVSFVTPQLAKVFPDIQFFNALSAAIVVGIMVIPTIASISQDAFEAVPRELREAGYGLGARKYQVAATIVFPAGLSGFIAAVILAFARAIGETMAVTLAAGSTPNLTFNLLESMQTITAYIVQVSLGDTPAGTIEYHSIFAVGLVLFAMTMTSNILAQAIVRRYQERYQ